jgi:hypothetical protein
VFVPDKVVVILFKYVYPAYWIASTVDMIQSALLADLTAFCISVALREVVAVDDPPPPQADNVSTKLSETDFKYGLIFEIMNTTLRK